MIDLILEFAEKHPIIVMFFVFIIVPAIWDILFDDC